MPNYVARATVAAELPSGYASAGLDNDTIDGFISRASLMVDEKVGVHYPKAYETSTQKFPEITDESNTTPATVEECAKLLALSKCLAFLSEENFGDEDMLIDMNRYRKEANDTLKQIRDGDIDLMIDKQTLFESATKYLTDESDRLAVFTNEDMDAHWP